MGITLVELMVAITIMGFVVAGGLAFARIGVSTKAIVDKEAQYSQELSFMSNLIIDGAGAQYRGLREATNVSSRKEFGCTRYTFHYFGSDPACQEHYWAENGMLHRSRGKEPVEQVGHVGAIEVSGPDARGMCTVRLASSASESPRIEHTTSVRLRNYPP